MRRLIANGFEFVSIVIFCSGCVSYSSQPIINEPAEPETKEIISSFSYAINSPWKDSRFGKDAYAATLKVIPDAQDTGSSLTAQPLPALEIKISEFSSGGASGQDYLTGLSLGLIPSWGTRKNLFKFDFILNKDLRFCRQNTYSINSTSFSHLAMIPFALFNTGDQPLALYQAALKKFIRIGQCATR